MTSHAKNWKMSHITGAAALDNKHTRLLFDVVMLPYTSPEDFVIFPYYAVCMYLMPPPLLLRTLPEEFG